MGKTYVAIDLRERVAAQARHRCGYCLTAETIVGTPMEIDHLIPESLGGLTEEQNLWLACSLCNKHKGPNSAGIDPATGQLAGLFHPRRQRRERHFFWDGPILAGRTRGARATIHVLAINDPDLVAFRAELMEEGAFGLGFEER